MSVRLSDEKFFCELLDTSVPGLSGIDNLYRESGSAAAEKQFADFIRTVPFPAEQYFAANSGGYKENSWTLPDEDQYAAAERIMRHELISCGFPYAFGERVDWEYNPTYNGYQEWTWQLSRHHEWRLLALCYRETGDERYARAFCELFKSWAEQTEVPENASGFATKCWRTIEIGIRIANNWPYAILSFCQSPSLSDSFITLFFKSLWENAWRVRNFNTSHNWLIMEMNGLAHFGILFRFFRDAQPWLTYALDRLTDEVDRQVYPDNFQFELTTGYHGVVINNYIKVMQLCRTMGIELPQKLLDGVKRMYRMYIQLADPDGRTPALNDGGKCAVKGALESARAFFYDDPEYAYYLSDGREGHAPRYTSTFMPYSGMAVFRSGWTPADQYLFFEAAPFGRAHQHEDKLEVVLHAYGKRLLDDFGSYAYDTSDMRKYILSSYSHNTALVDGMGQNRRATYHWEPEMITEPSGMRYCEAEHYAVAEGTYDEGYGPDLLKVQHTRRVLWLKKGVADIDLPFYVITDHFDSQDGEDHTYEMLWHLEAVPAMHAAHTVRGDYGDGVALHLIGEGDVRVAVAQKSPYMLGWHPIHKPEEHEHQPTPTAVYRVRGQHVTHVTVLFPTQNTACPVEAVYHTAEGCILKTKTGMITLSDTDYTF